MVLAKLPLKGFDPGGSILLAILPFAMVVGFVVGTIGHIYKSRRLVIAGVTIIFVVTLLLPLVFYQGSD